MKNYWSNDPEGYGLEFHATLEEAKAAAQAALDGYAENAGYDGWGECMEDICYGRVLGRVKETGRWTPQEWAAKQGGEYDPLGTPEWDEYVDYGLEDVS
jgi:hypothetical protein